MTADDELRKLVERGIPVGRMGTAEDVADAVAWLVADGAAFVNGATIVVDGGEMAGTRTTRKDEA